MSDYANEKHNELVDVEDRLVRISDHLTDLSNTLYRIDPQHPLLDEVSSAIHAVEDIDFEAPYADEKKQAGESWWDEA